MAKDPAILWYWSDWNSGTATFTRFLKGCYIDLLHAQFNSGPLSLEEIKVVLGSDFGQAWPTLSKKFKSENGLFFNERLELEKAKRKAFSESRRQSRLKADSDSVRLYLVKDDSMHAFKIGSSVNPIRRYNELNNQKSPAVMLTESQQDRRLTLVWYSNIVLRSEETKLHKHFESKRISGEWFLLSPDDILFITKTYEGTYVQRTENENENRIIEERKGGKGGRKEEQFPTHESFQHDLPEITIGSVIQLVKITNRADLSPPEVMNMFQAFKIQNLTGKKFYATPEDVFSHFINWAKSQRYVKSDTGITGRAAGARKGRGISAEDYERFVNS